MGHPTPRVCDEQTRVGPKKYAKKDEKGPESSFLSQTKEKSITKPLEAQSQRIHSPYMLGISPRMYASNVRLRTAAQSRSRLSCSTFSSSSSSSTGATLSVLRPVTVAASCFFCFSLRSAARAASSPALNLGPRSGKLRAGSNGFHLPSFG